MPPNGHARHRDALLAWFDREKRDLPWRRTRDPYAIWLSEVMLQQTQVATVIPYWERFLARFPTVTALANAPLDEVLSLWRGLGYYSRARNLHRAAQVVRDQHGGTFPADHAALLALPGLGRYTAGAVASIAFDLPAPIVDGNVARVLSRFHVIEGPPGDRARDKRLWEEAARWADGPRPGDLNQALMELGATVCRPVEPQCLLCPLRQGCEALRQGRVAELPPVKVRAPRKALTLVAGVWRDKDALLLGRRADAGLFGGLWQLPCVEADEREAEAALTGLFGVQLSGLKPIGTVKRTLTHRDLTIHLFGLKGPRLPKTVRGYAVLRWETQDGLESLGMSTAMVKAVALALDDSTEAAAPAASRTSTRRASGRARSARVDSSG